MRRAVHVPVIASGGAGEAEHLRAVAAGSGGPTRRWWRESSTTATTTVRALKQALLGDRRRRCGARRDERGAVVDGGGGGGGPGRGRGGAAPLPPRRHGGDQGRRHAGDRWRTARPRRRRAAWIGDALPRGRHPRRGVRRPRGRRRGGGGSWTPSTAPRPSSAGVPLWGTLVALAEGENVLAGAAYFPAVDEMVVAAQGAGCLWNGKPARVSGVSRAVRGAGADHRRAVGHATADRGARRSLCACRPRPDLGRLLRLSAGRHRSCRGDGRLGHGAVGRGRAAADHRGGGRGVHRLERSANGLRRERGGDATRRWPRRCAAAFGGPR